MGISLKQAFAFVPQDPKWITKVFIGGLILFFPSFVFIFPGVKRLLFDPINYYLITLFGLIFLTTGLAVSGYFFKTVHNRIIHDKGRLPSWKYFSYYIYVGLKSYIGGLIISIPFLMILALLMFFAPMTFGRELIPFIMIAGIVHIIYTAFYVMLALNFSLDFRISSFLNIKKAYSLIKDNLINYVLLVFDCLLVAVCNLILSFILLNGQILVLLLPFVSFYVCLVYTDLFAQFAITTGEEKYDENKCYV